jgi:hypothetical protein
MQAGYSLIWKADHDFEMQHIVDFSGSFQDAVYSLITNMHSAGNPLRARIYEHNHVFEISEE